MGLHQQLNQSFLSKLFIRSVYTCVNGVKIESLTLNMESTLLSGITQLSIGVISVLALVYVCIKFLEHLDKRTEKHETAMMERENQIRLVEKEVRTKVLDQLQQNSMVMADTVKSHERLMIHLDKKI